MIAGEEPEENFMMEQKSVEELELIENDRSESIKNNTSGPENRIGGELLLKFRSAVNLFKPKGNVPKNKIAFIISGFL